MSVVVRSGQSRPALLCIPGSNGDITGFFHLARRLGEEQPVTAFRFPEMNPRTSIEDLASRYITEVLAMQPEGPYFLAGACTGGLVAYEMARQLSAMAKPVGLLALIDCYNHAWGRELRSVERIGYGLGLLHKRLAYHRRNLRGLGLPGAAAYLRPRFAAFWQTTQQRWEERVYRWMVQAGLRPPRALRNSRVIFRHAAARYVPRSWDGRLELFRVEEPWVDGFDYPEMGWRGMAAGGIAIHHIPGSHLRMLMEPYVQSVAEKLNALLCQPELVR